MKTETQYCISLASAPITEPVSTKAPDDIEPSNGKALTKWTVESMSGTAGSCYLYILWSREITLEIDSDQ